MVKIHRIHKFQSCASQGHMYRKLSVSLLLLLLFYGTVKAQPIVRAHAHNDYVHKRPLSDALQNGFTSIEIDVFAHRNQLKVAHIPLALGIKKNIDVLYFKPLSQLLEKQNGQVYMGYTTPVILMVDFKNNPEVTYQLLKDAITPYYHYLTLYQNGQVIQQGAVEILVSGKVPLAMLRQEDTLWCTADVQITKMADSTLRPVVSRYSSAWKKFFTWTGKGEMPLKERKQLNELVTEANRLGKHIRFYHIPDKPNVWTTLLEAGVHWINTDRLRDFKKHYLTVYRR